VPYQSYNGWSGLVREARNGVFFGAIKSGKLDDKQPRCIGCGIHREEAQGTLGLHSEEYGPLPSEYIASCVPLCFRCHFLVHNRHKVPNRWRRYLRDVAQGHIKNPIVGGWFVGNSMLKAGDLEEEDWGTWETPNGYLSGLPLIPPAEPFKIAMVEVHKVAIPDPRLYLQGSLGEVIERPYSDGINFIKISLAKFLKGNGKAGHQFSLL
jgi:hypothetical protein